MATAEQVSPAEPAAGRLSDDQLIELLGLLERIDSVELKLTVPDADRVSTVERLDLDSLDAQIRQVAFFDTPDLRLDACGLVVRARRIQRKPGDSVVKLRPVVPDQLEAGVLGAPGFGLEVDAMPGGFVCSGSMKATVQDPLVKEVMQGRQPVSKLFSKKQRAFFAAYAPDDLELDSLVVLGPIHVLKLKFSPADLGRRMVAELWHYPDGARILELSTKCAPSDAISAAAHTRRFLVGHGVDLSAPQQTKTRSALEFFSARVSSGAAQA